MICKCLLLRFKLIHDHGNMYVKYWERLRGFVSMIRTRHIDSTIYFKSIALVSLRLGKWNFRIKIKIITLMHFNKCYIDVFNKMYISPLLCLCHEFKRFASRTTYVSQIHNRDYLIIIGPAKERDSKQSELSKLSNH